MVVVYGDFGRFRFAFSLALACRVPSFYYFWWSQLWRERVSHPKFVPVVPVSGVTHTEKKRIRIKECGSRRFRRLRLHHTQSIKMDVKSVRKSLNTSLIFIIEIFGFWKKKIICKNIRGRPAPLHHVLGTAKLRYHLIIIIWHICRSHPTFHTPQSPPTPQTPALFMRKKGLF